MKRLRMLDRYVLRAWGGIFVLTALGFPLITIVIDLTDNLNKWLDRGLSPRDILLSYFFSLPQNIFEVIPAAVLFATVFTVGALSRNTELTAAKASGQSFHRLVRPIFIAAAAACLFAIVIGEMSPGATARATELQRSKTARPRTGRRNFVYRGDAGWVYTIGALDLKAKRLRGLVLERQGTGDAYPGLIVIADSAGYEPGLGAWRLWDGSTRLLGDPGHEAVIQFSSLRLRALTQTPADLLVEPKDPEEMRYAELQRYINSLRRSGNDANKLIVKQQLKLTLPVACLVIALFGAPLAVTAPRAGTAIGIAISLGTTIIYLTMIQISQAVGASGVIDPIFAAWFPNVLFLGAALWLLRRVRT
jgi:lipopolysaccharide export system permease protein